MIQLEDKLYTSTEVADILGVSLRSVYRYLEEDKITAEVKTATGRHRFSKKNILDFLYPNGSDTVSQIKQEPRQDVQVKPVIKKKVVVKEASVEEEIEEEASVAPEEPSDKVLKEENVATTEEPIDWLAKFREAAKKYREESEQVTQTEKVVIEETVVVEETPMTMADVVKISEEPAFAQNVEVDKTKKINRQYYRSSLGGLKDIAQNIDRGSRNSFLDYAFTMNAGLSLYKPIKPFSMLHAYVRPQDVAFFEKLLGLTPTDEMNSQLCLVLSDEDKIYKSKEELHGLFVVSKEKLLDDVREMGDSILAGEASSILK
jgi:DNA polymerase III gamma/tau subunit